MDSTRTDESQEQGDEVANQNIHNVSVAESVVDGLNIQQKKSKGKHRVRIMKIISETEGARNCRMRSALGNRRKSASQLQNKIQRNMTLLSINDQPESKLRIRSTSDSCSKPEKPRRCPLRIAELAEPTKRQCIETWRERSHVLPEFMLDRLKQQVMNQKIVAQIPDAVDCFKIKSVRKKLQCTKKTAQARKKQQTVEELTFTTEARNIGALFAHHMAVRLIKSNVTCSNSSDRFKILSGVVANEINDLLFSNTRKRYPEVCYDTTILEEMSVKVAIWMISILNDSEQKMIEEELKAKKYKENRLRNDDSLVTLISTYCQGPQKNNQGLKVQSCDVLFNHDLDLDEEEGPALDAIDRILTNVFNICIPAVPEPVASTSSSVMEESKTEEISIPNTIVDNETSDAKYVEIISDAANVEIKEAIETTDIPIDQDDVESYSKYESIPDDDVDILTGNFDDEEVNINVSDVLVALEESLDERKKVKFTNVDNDPGAGELAGGEGGGRESNGGWESSGWAGGARPGFGGPAGLGGPEPGMKHAFQIGKRNEDGLLSPRLKKALSEISFRPPNESLLSIADENWPTDLNYSLLKISLSMTKSIASLANIQENEEGYDSQETESSSIENKDKFVSYESIKEETTDTTNSSPSDHVINGIVIHIVHNEDNELKMEDDTEKPKLTLETLSRQPSEEIPACNEDSCYKNAGKGDHLTTTDQSKNVSSSPVVQKCKKPRRPSELKFTLPNEKKRSSKLDYRVYPENAPSWVQASDSQETIQIITRCTSKKMSKCELRRWCVDMEQTAGNLKEWNRWLDAICTKVLRMKQQSEVDNMFSYEDRSEDLQDWLKLKKNLDKDALLWKKLTNRTLDVLKSYHDPYPPLIASDVLDSTIPKEKIKRQSIMETLYTIEGLSLWLHRSIVSTENSVKCNCSRIIKKSTSPETTTSTEPSCSAAFFYNNLDEIESSKNTIL